MTNPMATAWLRISFSSRSIFLWMAFTVRYHLSSPGAVRRSFTFTSAISPSLR
jgi:hypothetical protein